jgi:hypothetical protein
MFSNFVQGFLMKVFLFIRRRRSNNTPKIDRGSQDARARIVRWWCVVVSCNCFLNKRKNRGRMISHDLSPKMKGCPSKYIPRRAKQGIKKRAY